MEDYQQYDLSENDHYLIPNSTCLKNLLDFTSITELNAAEEVFTKAALAELVRNTILGNFDLKHLQLIYRYIFQHVYEWAAISQESMGLACREARTVDFEAKKLSKLLGLNVLKIE